jgi:hypothetical protein
VLYEYDAVFVDLNEEQRLRELRIQTCNNSRGRDGYDTHHRRVKEEMGTVVLSRRGTSNEVFKK